MAKETSGLKLPTYSLSRIFNKRDQLIEKAFLEFHGFTPTGECFDDLIDQVQLYLPGVKRITVYDSLRELAGKLLTPDLIRTTAWRMAANMNRLKQGFAVPPWSSQPVPEWVPVQIMNYNNRENAKGQSGGLYHVKTLAGTPATMVMTRWWSKRFCYAISRRIGFTWARHGCPFQHPSELVRLRMFVLITPEKSANGKPDFTEIGCTASLKSYNQTIIGLRNRRAGKEVWDCPFGLEHVCHACYVGYDQCPAAVRPRTLELPEEEYGSTQDEGGSTPQEGEREEGQDTGSKPDGS